MPASTFQKPISTLLIGKNAQSLALFDLFFQGMSEPTFEVETDSKFDDLQNVLTQKKYELVLVELSGRDNEGLEVVLQVAMKEPEATLLVYSRDGEDEEGLQAIREGAQDHLVVNSTADFVTMRRQILYAMERQRKRVMLQHLSFNDDLTGLLNRRGFLSLAAQHIKVAQRVNWGVTLFFFDLDDLKVINDRYGHPEGDRALRVAANLLRETFRGSDLTARLGGDEFVVLAINVSGEGIETLTQRLVEKLQALNERPERYRVSMSWGVARFSAHHPASLEEMIAEADGALYDEKRKRKVGRGGEEMRPAG